MPAKAGIQKYLKTLDSRLRGNDAKGRFETFYESIKVAFKNKASNSKKYSTPVACEHFEPECNAATGC